MMLSSTDSNSMDSIELVDEGPHVPYHDGLSLGNGVDFAKPFEKGRRFVSDNISPTTTKIDRLSCKFRLAENFSQVCDVLNIPPEYALKANFGLVHDDIVKTCLLNICTKNTFKIIFNLRYISTFQYYPNRLEIAPHGDPLLYPDDDSIAFDPVLNADDDSTACEPLINPEDDSTACEPLINPYDDYTALAATHVVDGLYTGDELVVVLTISGSDSFCFRTFKKKMKKALSCQSGHVERDILKTIEDLGKRLESKLKKADYQSISLDIQCGSKLEMGKHSLAMGDLIEVTKSFINRCNTSIPTLHDETEIDDESQATTAEQTSFNPLDAYDLKVALQPICPNRDPRAEGYSEVYEVIFATAFALDKTLLDFQDFRTRYHQRGRDSESEEIIKKGFAVKLEMKRAIEAFDMVSRVPMEEANRMNTEVEEIADKMNTLIEKKTTNLPAGGDINLLIIGKTGHGKSSLANAIVGRDAFKVSSKDTSETKSLQWACTEIDNRRIRVVDVPGVCDTNLESLDSLKHAISCITGAILECPDGFNALLLVFRYPTRMTAEEQRAVYLLKCIMGQTLVHCHGICVVTHGDNFDEESFEDWCKGLDGSLKDLFEECNSRCVLFDNKTTDPCIQRSQLIELVTKVDSLEDRSKRYTSDIFKLAANDRKKLQEEKNLRFLGDEFMTELNLLQNDFKNAEKADRDQKKPMMSRLKNAAARLLDKVPDFCWGIYPGVIQTLIHLFKEVNTLDSSENADVQLATLKENVKKLEEELRKEKAKNMSEVFVETEERVIDAFRAQEEKESANKDAPPSSIWGKLKEKVHALLGIGKYKYKPKTN